MNSNAIVHLRNDKYALNTWERLDIFREVDLKSPCVTLVQDLDVGSSCDVDLEATFPNLCPILEVLREKCISTKTSRMTTQLFSNLKGFPLCKMDLFRALRKWIFTIIPTDIIGGSKNLSAFAQNLKIILGKGKRCQVRLQSIILRLKPAKVKWLNIEKASDLQKEVALAKVVLFLTKFIVWRLLRSYFCVSDTSWARNMVCFYRKRDFQATLQSALAKMEAKGYIQNLSSKTKVDQILKIPEAPPLRKARLMPKKFGYRLIASPVSKSQSGQHAEDLKVVLSHIKSQYPETVDIRGKMLHSLWTKFAKIKGQQKVYFVKADIKHAYESVSLRKLASILTAAVSQLPSEMFVISVKVQHLHTDMITRKTILSKTADDLGLQSYRLLSKEVRTISPGEMIRELSKKIQLHTLVFSCGRKQLFFLKKNGLIQGEPLSSLLCDIYYGHVVKKELKPRLREYFEKGASRMLIRAVDDFLFMSTSSSEAER
jgi:telomerase reverse transcriptase